MGGQIQVIFGPMFSGKTTELLRRVKRYELARFKCIVVKYDKDIRYEGVSTHDNQSHDALSTNILSDVRSNLLLYEVIGIDEGQFFVDIVDIAEEMAMLGKIVIIAGLDGDYRRKPFGSMINLVPLAESVVKLTAVCLKCYGEDSFSKRNCVNTQLEIIGGSEQYTPVCRDCL